MTDNIVVNIADYGFSRQFTLPILRERSDLLRTHSSSGCCPVPYRAQRDSQETIDACSSCYHRLEE